ncbi:MAG: hypothetical protein [Wendovervirus sonii]|uniref:Uncharacterized protein n=1 Tax=phage Lak_Megaphage_Sonny TaxID=3109229 RepID=A0ABZ0Z359_9CAUD|nr:MAG: hypothetical protein [phage Lak_Megaphage_Sonny]
MYTLYMTSVPESKLKTLYANIKNFFILDVQAFVKSMNLDLSKKSSIYIVNDELQKLIISQMKLKKFKGVIYINKNLSEIQINSFRQYFQNKKKSIRLILIDNGQFPQHDDIMDFFDEVLFYERFRKNKIVECDGFEKTNEHINYIIMDENEPVK